ncbi:hypothetical protein PLESTB_001354500 [Pleodorina starrii]|uniref:Inositol polyphosphate multikinase n=1 Tax=Pleodorina starrii TaxID=330485 RepID=A0A9W6BU24_9CHLO|nr:hypothetical protein PLESTM_001914300 [Pleodorina starrii]GLC58399.1 hypothetical protein PLESTB_001354500 [Pleodorina starrii]GLC76462.1 hypothetical protein PLESTF_001783900 [Pleodorina starrii]
MEAVVATAEATEVTDLKPCEHQAGGHFAVGKHAATFVDGSGKFYKLFQDDVRSGREASIYETIFAGADDDEVRKEDMVAFRHFVPKYFGIVVSGDKKLLALEDTCSAYQKPCVIDAKMGLTTIYDWSDGKYKAKNATKDLVTTQSTLGFRVTGFKVWQQDKGEYFVADRSYGKELTAETMPAALTKFGSNGSLTPRDVYGGPDGAVAKIRCLQSWFEAQRSLLFFAASIIVVYEGAATRPEEANVTIRFIDFAHTFPSKGKRDDNVLPGVKILADLLERVAEDGGQRQ